MFFNGFSLTSGRGFLMQMSEVDFRRGGGAHFKVVSLTTFCEKTTKYANSSRHYRLLRGDILCALNLRTNCSEFEGEEILLSNNGIERK